MAHCVLRAENLDKNGNRVPSKLFDLLEEYFGTLQDAWKYYDLSRQPEFRELNPSVVQYDEFGDMTFLSFLKASLIDADEVKLVRMLNKELQSGEYPVKEAIEKVAVFNKTNSKEDYIGVLNFTEEGKAKIEVVRNTYENRLNLKNTIQSMNFFERMQYKLNSLGIGVKLIDSTTIRGKYDNTTTKNVEDALHYLISVANGELVEMDKTLAREIGHLIQGSMRHNPILERIESLLTDEVIKSIFGEEFLNQKNYKKEALGHLIGDELYRNQTLSGLKNLLNRLISSFKRVWARVTHNDVMNAHEEARLKAIMLVLLFLEEDYSLDEDSIFEERELLYDRNAYSKCETMFHNCLIALSKLRDSYKAIDPKTSYELSKSIAKVESGRTSDKFKEMLSEELFNYSMFDGVLDALKELSTYYGQMFANLDSARLSLSSNVASVALNPKVALNIRITSSYVSQVTELIEMLEKNLKSMAPEYSTSVAPVRLLINLYRKSLIGYIDAYGNELSGIVDYLTKLKDDYSLRFLEQIYGKGYVKSAKRRIWGEKGLESTAIDLSLENLLEVLNDDISLFGRFFTNAANCGDIITEIIDKGVKEADTTSNLAIMQVWDALKVFRARMTEAIGSNDTSMFYERDEDGNLTGNFISPDGYCWGAFYKAKSDFIKEEKKKFKEEMKNRPDLSDIQIEMEWGKRRSKLEKLWYKDNTTTVGDKKIPIDKYKSNLWQELKSKYPEAIPIYDEVMMYYLNIIDNTLNPKTMPYRRAPLIRGSLQSAIVELMKLTNPLSATFSVLKRRLMAAFVKNADDLEFGSNHTYNSADEDPAYHPLKYEQEFIERAPLYFINPLENKLDLRTDMFSSIEAFTVMATKYKSMSTIVDSVEIVREKLLERIDKKTNKYEKNLPNTVRRIKDFFKLSNAHTRAYNRLCKYIDMLIYNNYFDVDASKQRVITSITKLLQFVSTVGSRVFLMGNTYGALANVGTGAIEIFKEALADDVIHNYGKANSVYFKGIVESLFDYGREYKSSKLNLFLAMLDTQHNLATDASGWHPGATLGKDALNIKHSRLARLIKAPFDFFVLYKAGDHYMQAIPYLSIALDLTFYNPTTGERCNMYEVFDCVPIDNDNPKAGNKLVFRDGFIKESKMQDVETYNKLKEVLSVFNTDDKLVIIASLNANLEYLDFLYSLNLLIKNSLLTEANIDRVKLDLLSKKSLFGVSTGDISDIRNVAREMSVRMHGIYNNMDKTALHGSLAGALMAAMKGYAFGMVLRRFGPNTYNVLLDRNVEGTLNTMSKIAYDYMIKGNHRNIDREHGKRSALEVIQDIWQFVSLAAYPFSKKQLKVLQDLGYDEWQIANTIRNFGDYAAIALFQTFEWILENIDEEEELNLLLGNVLYFVTRLGAEQSAFNNPAAFFMRELPSVINPDRSVGWSFTGQFIKNLWYLVSNTEYERNQYSTKNPKFEYGYKKGENKGLHWFERYAPLLFGFLPNPWLRVMHILQDPERARETYLFSKQYGSK